VSDIKIGVSATPGNAKTVLDGIDNSAQQAAAAVDSIGRAGQAAAAGLNKIDDAVKKLDLSSRRLKSVATTLSKEFGQPISHPQSASFLQSYERMRANRNLSGGSKIRQFDTFEEWLAGNRQMFVNQQEANRYKHRVLSMAASGAQINAQPPATTPSGGQDDPPIRTPNTFEQGVNKAGSAAMSFGKGMLALAGLNSITGMAGRSLDMATEESTSSDALKRSLGDVNVGFEDLKEQLREAGKGLGFASVEAARMAQQFAHVANAGPGTNLGADVRHAAGFSRSYGMDLGGGMQFFAQARELHMTSNETESRRLALMIAESIDKGKNTAKADEVLSAVANFSTQAARLSLAPPNATGFAGMLAGMTQSGVPGLDVAGSSSIINRANDTIARGGGMGEAGKNFLFYALGGGKHGLDPVQAMALAEGGLFGSSMDSFGPNSALGQYYGKTDNALSSRTNLSNIRGLLDKQYGGNKSLKLDAAKNLFGLNYNQAAAFLNVKPAELGNLEPLLAKNGIRLDQLSATGYNQLAQVGSADAVGLHQIAATMLGRSDVSDSDKADIHAAEASGPDSLRNSLAKMAAKYEQEMTEGKKTANDIAGINQALTNSGSYLLTGVNQVKEGVLALVTKFAPESGYARRGALNEAITQLQSGGHRAAMSPQLSQQVHDEAAQKLISDRQAMGKMDQKTIDRIYRPNPNEYKGNEDGMQYQLAQWEEIRRQAGLPVQPDEMYKVWEMQAPKRAPAPAPGTTGRPERPAGSSMPSSVARGIRNNNPGNIRTGRDNWLGKIGDDGAFVQFATPEHGLRAMAMNLRTQARKNGATVAGIVGAWAPPNENETGSYIDSVAAKIGVRPGQKLDLNDNDTMTRLMRAMILQENGGSVPYSAAQFNSALSMLPGGAKANQAATAAPLSGAVHGTIDVRVHGANGHATTQQLPVTLRPSIATAAGTQVGSSGG